MFTRLTALTVSSLRYCWAYFTKSSEYLLNRSTYPNLFSMALVNEHSYSSCSAPYKIWRMVLVYKCDFMKISHISSAIFEINPSSALGLIFTIFLSEITRCFWKLWNKDFYLLLFFLRFYGFDYSYIGSSLIL